MDPLCDQLQSNVDAWKVRQERRAQDFLEWIPNRITEVVKKLEDLCIAESLKGETSLNLSWSSLPLFNEVANFAYTKLRSDTSTSIIQNFCKQCLEAFAKEHPKLQVVISYELIDISW